MRQEDRALTQIRSTPGRSRGVPRPSLVAPGAGLAGVRCWRCAVVRWAAFPGAGHAGCAGRPGCGGQVGQAAAARVRLPCLAGAGSWQRLAPSVRRPRRPRPLRSGLGGGWRRDRRSGRLQPVRSPCGRGVRATGAACDDQMSWPTATRTAPDLACVIADGHSVRPWIDGKEKVYGSIGDRAGVIAAPRTPRWTSPAPRLPSLCDSCCLSPTLITRCATGDLPSRTILPRACPSSTYGRFPPMSMAIYPAESRPRSSDSGRGTPPGYPAACTWRPLFRRGRADATTTIRSRRSWSGLPWL